DLDLAMSVRPSENPLGDELFGDRERDQLASSRELAPSLRMNPELGERPGREFAGRPGGRAGGPGPGQPQRELRDAGIVSDQEDRSRVVGHLLDPRLQIAITREIELVVKITQELIPQRFPPR